MECQRKRCIQEKEKPLFSKIYKTKVLQNLWKLGFIATAPLAAYLETGTGCAEPWSQAQNPQNGRPSLQPLGWIKKERFLLKEDGSYHLCHLSALEVHGELFHQGGGGGKIWETTEEKNLSSLINAK